MVQYGDILIISLNLLPVKTQEFRYVIVLACVPSSGLDFQAAEGALKTSPIPVIEL